MSGISRHTGQPIDTLASALQGVEVILSTPQGSRLMRRSFGASIVELLGKAITPQLLPAFGQLVATAIDLWEPRFKVRSIVPSGSVEDIRRGALSFQLLVDFRPRALTGDMSVERSLNFSLLSEGPNMRAELL